MDVDNGYMVDVPTVYMDGANVKPSRYGQTHHSQTEERVMTQLQSSTVRDQVAPAEWEQRVALAAAYRLVAHFGWDDLIFTHLSARVPGSDHHYLINPYGMTFDEITASSLVKVDLAGTKVMDSPYQINPAGFTIHSAIHAARENAKCVLHVHSVNGAAVSAQKNGVLPISQQSMFVLSSLAYHDYEGVALRDDEKPRLVRDLGDKNFFMLRNHGLITVADNIPDAFLFMYTFESACMIQLRAQAGGGELIPIDPFILATAQQQAATVTEAALGALAWPALLRKLDRIDPSYRH
jgi:ribulose-5-phosphate 4-epimerase/fuculose-1-phosphate aldolase